jgi:hypothetical protein
MAFWLIPESWSVLTAAVSALLRRLRVPTGLAIQHLYRVILTLSLSMCSRSDYGLTGIVSVRSEDGC